MLSLFPTKNEIKMELRHGNRMDKNVSKLFRSVVCKVEGFRGPLSLSLKSKKNGSVDRSEDP